MRLVDQQYLVCDTCQMYQWMGIPCRHIIHIIDNIDFDAKYIPIQYHRKYLIYADQSKHSQISENIKLARKVQYPGPPLPTELVDEKKEYPYNWRGPSHPMEWYTEVLNSNIPLLSNYDMKDIKHLFTATTNGIIASNGREIMSLNQESHDDKDGNNDNDDFLQICSMVKHQMYH